MTAVMSWHRWGTRELPANVFQVLDHELARTVSASRRVLHRGAVRVFRNRGFFLGSGFRVVALGVFGLVEGLSFSSGIAHDVLLLISVSCLMTQSHHRRAHDHRSTKRWCPVGPCANDRLWFCFRWPSTWRVARIRTRKGCAPFAERTLFDSPSHRIPIRLKP
jgi:hypothetical protein